MKEPEMIQRFPEPGQISSDNDRSKLFNKDHNYFSVEEKCTLLMPESLAKTKDVHYGLDKSAIDSSFSDVFQNGTTHFLSFQSDSPKDSLLPVDITTVNSIKETPRSNRSRLETRFRTNSSDSAFSEDSLIDFEGDNDAKLESLINQLIFNSEDLQTDLSSYVKSDNNATFSDIDSFDVNDLFCSDVIYDNSKSTAVHYSDLASVERTCSSCNGDDSLAKQQSPHLLIKTDSSFPMVEISKVSELEARQSLIHTAPSIELIDSSDVVSSHTKGDQVDLHSTPPLNTDILEMRCCHKDEFIKREITISSPTILQNAENYENPSEYCIIGIDGNVHKDNTELDTDDMKTIPGGDELKYDIMKIKTEPSVTDCNLDDSILESDQSERQCQSHPNSEIGIAQNTDVTVRNDMESEAFKGDNPLLQSLCFFDALDTYDDVQKSYKSNDGLVFSNVFESESSRPQKNDSKNVSENLVFDKHFDMKTECSENTSCYLTEQFTIDSFKGRTLNDYLSREKQSDFGNSISNKDHLKSILKDLFLNEEYFEQNKTSQLLINGDRSPTEEKEAIEDYNTKLLRSLDVLAILSPQSQASNDMEMLIEQTDSGVQFKDIDPNSLVTSSQKHSSKKRPVHNINFLTQGPQQLDEVYQENSGIHLHNGSEMTDNHFVGGLNGCNIETDFVCKPSIPSVLSYKDVSEKFNSKTLPSFKIISSDDSDNKQIKVPRLSLNRKHSVDSNLVGDSLLRKVLTGKLSSPTSFFTNGMCVKEKEKNYETIRFPKPIDFSNCPIVNKTLANFTSKFPSEKSVEMSELEKYLRGMIPTVGINDRESHIADTDLDGHILCQKYTGRSFLKRLLTGELNSDMYHEIDAKLCKQERISKLVKKMNKTSQTK